MSIKSLGVALLAATLVTLAGCASFPQERLPKAAAAPDVSAFQNKPRVFVDLKFFRGAPGAPGVVDITQSARASIQPIVVRELDASKLFASYSFDEAAKADADATIELHFFNHGSTGGAAVSGFITGFTFGVIPGAATDHYALQSRVLPRAGEPGPVHRSDDALRTWVGIWFIPVAGKTPQKGMDAVLSNMTRDALNRVMADDRLMYSSLAPTATATIAP